MGLANAVTAQGMATRHRRSVKAVVNGLNEVNALLARVLKKKKIKWNGYGTYFEWYVRKLKETSSWNTGQLGSRTFEEKDPMDKAELPYCFIDETYGVSEKSIKTNRAAGSEKLYDIQKENARNAQNALYRAIVDALYSNGADDPLEPSGLLAAVGDAYETTGNVTIAALKSYAGITLTTAGVSAYSTSYTTQGFDNEYWYPIALDVNECPASSATPKWSTDAVKILQWMVYAMQRTADVSGTGKIIKPDMALMNTDPWTALTNILATSQSTYNVMLGNSSPDLANFSTINVNGLDVVYDENVPDDSGSKERILVLDSKAFAIETCNTKSEGLVEGDWKTDDPEVVGGVGVYKSNLGFRIDTPHAIGVVTGASD